MTTIFPREERPELLFETILKDPEACERLRHLFYGELGVEDADEAEGELSAQQFARALFDAYENRDLTAFLIAICENSMFDLLRNASCAPFRINADGHENPILLTDEDGNLLPGVRGVSDHDYRSFKHIYECPERERGHRRAYLVRACRLHHRYDPNSMEVEELVRAEHLGVLLAFGLPDTVQEKKTEAEAYAALTKIVSRLEHELPRTIVYYGQDAIQEGGVRYDEMGVFLPIGHLSHSLAANVKRAEKIVAEG